MTKIFILKGVFSSLGVRAYHGLHHIQQYFSYKKAEDSRPDSKVLPALRNPYHGQLAEILYTYFFLSVFYNFHLFSYDYAPTSS